MTFCEVFIICLAFNLINAKAQNNDQLVNDRIQNVFGLGSADNRGGFGEIVTPEPEITPTLTPQFISNNGESCKCVPYTMCTPTSDPLSTTDSRFFGELDIR